MRNSIREESRTQTWRISGDSVVMVGASFPENKIEKKVHSEEEKK